MHAKDISILRDLAKRYLEICHDPLQAQRCDLWRKHNSFERVPPPIYVRSFAWREMPEAKLLCQDKFFRQHEDFFRQSIFRSSFMDDFVFEPWVTVNAGHKCGGWGVDSQRNYVDETEGMLTAYKLDYVLKETEDFTRLIAPWHEIDEDRTAERQKILEDAIGDIICVNLDRAPAYRRWSADIATTLGQLRGIENFMMDMYDNPACLHRLLAFLRDGVLRTHDQAEQAGDWGRSNHDNQAMPYAMELADPAANVFGVKRSQLWNFTAAQEFALVSPEMHDEFLLQYQLPIMSKFALVAYGCCEDLTHKIDILRKIPNLRRIAVSPFANVASCAEQIGTDYIVSYRPSPADMVSYRYDEERIKRIISKDVDVMRRNDCHFDVTLKDVETVEKDPTRIKRWVALTRKCLEQ
jgi:hypothetical protein